MRRYQDMAPQCPMCAKPLVEIRLASAAATLRSCNRCDLRWWARDDEPAPLASVLDTLAGPD